MALRVCGPTSFGCPKGYLRGGFSWEFWMGGERITHFALRKNAIYPKSPEASFLAPPPPSFAVVNAVVDMFHRLGGRGKLF